MDALLLHIIQCDDTVPSDRKIANEILKLVAQTLLVLLLRLVFITLRDLNLILWVNNYSEKFHIVPQNQACGEVVLLNNVASFRRHLLLFCRTTLSYDLKYTMK